MNSDIQDTKNAIDRIEHAIDHLEQSLRDMEWLASKYLADSVAESGDCNLKKREMHCLRSQYWAGRKQGIEASREYVDSFALELEGMKSTVNHLLSTIPTIPIPVKNSYAMERNQLRCLEKEKAKLEKGKKPNKPRNRKHRRHGGKAR